MNDFDDGFEPDVEDDGFVPDEPVKPERHPVAKAARVASQYALGRVEGSAPGIVYDIGTAPARSRGYLTNLSLEDAGNEIESLYEKNAGKSFEQWDAKDKEIYEDLSERIKNPGKVYEEQKPVDLSIKGLAGAVTGIDFTPEGALEKAANWAGFVKDPTKAQSLLKIGLNPKELAKSILPYPKEIFRGIGAGTALQMAEDNQFGPIGTIAAAIAGDIIGHAPKGIYKAVTNPKQTAAQAVNFLTLNNTKRLAATQIAEDFAKSGIQVDAGTLTGSPLVQMMQARLTQSGLTGSALDNFRKELSGQITKEYENIIGDLGELAFENNHQAAEAIKNAVKVEEVALNIPKESLKEQQANARSLQGRVAVQERPDYQEALLNRIAPEETQSSYQGGVNLKTVAEDIRTPVKEDFDQRWTNLNQQIAEFPAQPEAQLARTLENFVAEHEGSLLLGESAPESRVLGSAQRLLQALRTEEGGLIGVTLNDLIKTKRTLADVANWEIAGSDFESAYKRLVGDINAAIDRQLVNHPELRNEFLHLNADYSAFKDTFENKNVQKLFEPKNENYNSLYNEFVNNPDKLRSLEDVMHNNPRGDELINQVKRDHAQKILEKPSLTARDIRDLQQTLGPQFDPDILEFITRRQEALEHPLPRPAPQERLGINAQIAPQEATKPITGRKVSETGTERAKAGLRKKYAEFIAGKKPEQILSEMDTVDGIRKMRRVLETTSEGKELFKELSRFKLAEMIDKKMSDAITEQVKLGKFSNLLNSQKNKDIVKELIGKDAYKRLELLQKNAGRLAQSAGRFFNASQSGTTIVDAGLVGTAFTGVLLGNPWMAIPAIGKIGGSYVLANLLSDPIFLKELEKAIKAPPKDFKKFLTEMLPKIEKAHQEATRLNKEGKD